MNAWSEYLRGQAVIADRVSKAMTTTETIKEFAHIAASFRHDADVEDANPTYKHSSPRTARAFQQTRIELAVCVRR